MYNFAVPIIKMMNLLPFLKRWTLPVSMVVGAVSYFIASSLDLSYGTRKAMHDTVSVVQPVLLFLMLFLTFSKVRVRDMKICKWQWWVLLFQIGCFAVLALSIILTPKAEWHVVAESAMICFICPTATAAAVVTSKLGGDAGSLTAYTLIINLCASLLIPLTSPLVHPDGELSFVQSFLLISGKVFPLLIMPFVMAVIFRKTVPGMVKRYTAYKDLPFYLWAVGLALAIAVTVHTIVHSRSTVFLQAAIVGASLLACVMQFAYGRWIGKKYGEPITAAQSCGQKNTVLAIWVGYTFFTPITAIAGGFYSVWHNVWNSIQLAHVYDKKADRTTSKSPL